MTHAVDKHGWTLDDPFAAAKFCGNGHVSNVSIYVGDNTDNVDGHFNEEAPATFNIDAGHGHDTVTFGFDVPMHVMVAVMLKAGYTVTKDMKSAGHRWTDNAAPADNVTDDQRAIAEWYRTLNP